MGTVTILVVLIIIIFVVFRDHFSIFLQNELSINRNSTTNHSSHRKLEAEREETVPDVTGMDNEQYLTVRSLQTMIENNERNVESDYEDIASLVRKPDVLNVNNGFETDTLSLACVYEDMESSVCLNNGQYLTVRERSTEIRGNDDAKPKTDKSGNVDNGIRLNNGQYLTVVGRPGGMIDNAHVEPIATQLNNENKESTKL